MSIEGAAPRRLTEGDEVMRFVGDLYRVFNGRDPDPSGREYYADIIRNGASLGQVVSDFATSEEFTARVRRQAMSELVTWSPFEKGVDPDDGHTTWTPVPKSFPQDYTPPGEAGRSYLERVRTGFLDRYCGGALVLDIGHAGYDNPEKKTALPSAIGVDLEYPGYDGVTLPFESGTVDTVFSSHCLEHIQYDHAAIRDWYRVLKIGGFIVCIVPSQALYEKRRFLPSRFNEDHKRMYTPANLVRSFEDALEVNSYRVRHLSENDRNFNYELGPETHSDGAYEIEFVIEKIAPPKWTLA